MKLLEERIQQEGKVFPKDVLKIDSFLNHQIDTALAREIGKEFHRIFENSRPTKILTIEASGIAFALTTAMAFGDLPVVFAKKTSAANMDADQYRSKCYSFTRQMPFEIAVAKEYLSCADRVLIIDDFLANGEAMSAMIALCKAAGAEVAGCGAVLTAPDD